MRYLVLLAVIGCVAGQTTIRRVVVNDGSYRGYDDGKYRPDGSGRYTGDNGKYVHDDKGYVHQEPLYIEKPQPQIIYITSPAPTTATPTTAAPTTTTAAPTTTNAAPTTTTPAPTTTAAPTTPITIIQYVQKPQVEYVQYPIDRQHNYNTEGGWKIVRHLKESNQEGYNYAYETENKILGQESGRIYTDSNGLRANGFFEYIGDNGVLYRVDYLADENGFQPFGAHFPVGPVEIVETLSNW